LIITILSAILMYNCWKDSRLDKYSFYNTLILKVETRFNGIIIRVYKKLHVKPSDFKK